MTRWNAFASIKAGNGDRGEDLSWLVRDTFQVHGAHKLGYLLCYTGVHRGSTGHDSLTGTGSTQ